MENQFRDEIHDCLIKLRVDPTRRRDKVYIGCGAGFGGDRPMAAFKLLQSVKELNYLVLECLAERTLAERYKEMMSGGDGYDPRISEWMLLLLPLAVERGTCIITNMGAMDPIGAQHKVLQIAHSLGLDIVVAIAHEVASNDSGSRSMDGGISTYLGAAPIVRCLELQKPHVIITSRVADAALFLAPMVYELGWNWNDLEQLAQGALAGHLLECGCQLTGGYFMHPGDKYRDISFARLLDLSLPFAEVSYGGEVCVAKADGSGGLLNLSTCAQQLLYEVADPSAYITPDVIIDIRDVTFRSLSHNKVLCTGAKPSAISTPGNLLQLVPKECGWKGWGEVSYGGYECVKRAIAAEYLVRSWIEELNPVNSCIVSYMIGLDSLKASGYQSVTSIEAGCRDIRLRMDGIFPKQEDAIQFVREFTALYTNGPAGGGGISTGHKKEILLEKQLVGRDSIFWHVGARSKNTTNSLNQEDQCKTGEVKTRAYILPTSIPLHFGHYSLPDQNPNISTNEEHARFPAPSGKKLFLYEVVHSRVGDKGNDLNFSIIPHFPSDIERLKIIINPQWVKQALAPLLNPSPFLDPDAIQKRDEWLEENVKVEIYEVRGIHSLNVVVRNILDGGVNCSRRIDRHGKTISDIILSQQFQWRGLKSPNGISPHGRQMSNYSSMDGVLYCKTHFEQLFKESGDFRKNFQTGTKPPCDNTPNKFSSMFSGTQDKCPACNKTVYPLEKIGMEGESYHKCCFRCAVGGCPLTHSSYAALDGILYCKHHFQQLFMEKGNYNHVKDAAKKHQASLAEAEHEAEEPPAEAEPEAEPKPADEGEPEEEPPAEE